MAYKFAGPVVISAQEVDFLRQGLAFYTTDTATKDRSFVFKEPPVMEAIEDVCDQIDMMAEFWELLHHLNNALTRFGTTTR